MMEPLTLGLLILLGSWVALDGTAFGQFMISRPFVSGTATGFVLGDPLLGALVGGLLELLFLGSFPVGGARLPEPGPAAIPAVVLAVGLAGPSLHASGGALAAGIALGVVFAWVGGGTVRLQRAINGRISARAWRRGGRQAELRNAQLSGLVIDGFRGAVITGAGLFVVEFAVRWGAWLIPGPWPLAGAETLALAGIGGALGLGRLAQGAAGGTRRVVRRPVLLLLVGMGCGVAMAITLGGLFGHNPLIEELFQ